MAKAITLNDIMRKLDDIDASIAQMQFDLDNMGKDKKEPKTRTRPNWKKAKDVPIGSIVLVKNTTWQQKVIGHGNISDNVVVLEDAEGDITTENFEDIWPFEGE